MWEAFKQMFKAPKESENIYDLIQSSEQRATGWYRIEDRLGRFIGYSWHCPGRLMRTTIPAPKGSSADQAEVPVMSRIGCSFQSTIITPDESGIANVRARCVHTSSNLTDFLKEMGISVKDLPSKCLSKPFTADKYHDPWTSSDGGNEAGYSYQVADPGAAGMF
jgi:hypothetical protein